MADQSDYTIFTRSVLGGGAGDSKTTQPNVPPIVPSVGHIHANMRATDHALGSPGGDIDHPDEYVYARNGGPTQALFESAVASLEKAESALSFSSGLAAIHASILSLVAPGGDIVAADQLYGTTRSLLDWLSGTYNIRVHYVDFLDTSAAMDAIKKRKPSAVYCELLTNPTVRLVEINEIVKASHNAGAKVIVDNTFATPFLINLLEWGVDLVVHSATKFLNGHGDVLGGVIAGPDDLVKIARGYRKMLGANLGAFEAWLALRGMKTFSLRMRQACLGARQIAAALSSYPRINEIYYPGLRSDPQHELANRLFRQRNFGAMVAFELDQANQDLAFKFMESLKIIKPVTSLGDVSTLISHPATASHRGLTPDQRKKTGITDGLLRLSVGIEEPNELIEDLVDALNKL